MKDDEIRLRAQILDREVIDSEFFPCGKIADVEFKGEPGKPLRISTILLGPGAWSKRLPASLQLLVEKTLGTEEMQIPWEQIKGVGSHIQLRSNVFDLKLNVPDLKIAPKLRKLPKGS
jgi:sporulation protein YlmC with PRC-barrel domain